MWASGHNGDIRRAAHGYEPTREAAMAAFKKSSGGNDARKRNASPPSYWERCHRDGDACEESAHAAKH